MRFLAVLLLLALLAGCADPAPSEPGTVLVPRSTAPVAPVEDDDPVRGELAFETIAQGVHSGHSVDGMHVQAVLDEPAWLDFWAEHDPDTDAPDIDFEASIVIAVFMGDQDSTGHSIEVTGVRATDAGVLVDTRGVSPQDACVIGPTTEPHHIVQVPRDGLRPLEVRSGKAVWEEAECDA